jgi:hypothetical protein
VLRDGIGCGSVSIPGTAFAAIRATTALTSRCPPAAAATHSRAAPPIQRAGLDLVTDARRGDPVLALASTEAQIPRTLYHGSGTNGHSGPERRCDARVRTAVTTAVLPSEKRMSVSTSPTGDPETVEEARAHPEVFAHKTVGQVADHFAEVIGRLARKPAVIGHSFGGLLTQILAGRGLSAASVAIDPAPFRGVLPLPISALRPVTPEGRIGE